MVYCRNNLNMSQDPDEEEVTGTVRLEEVTGTVQWEEVTTRYGWFKKSKVIIIIPAKHRDGVLHRNNLNMSQDPDEEEMI